MPETDPSHKDRHRTEVRPVWVPIRSLAVRHRERIANHLLALNESDRYLRFGFAANDEQVHRYVDGIAFDHDEIFGIFNRRLELIAMAHLAYPSDTDRHPGGTAEFGVSVLAPSRGRGFGARLFEHAVLHARNRHIDTLFIHALSENAAMLRIARNAGATVERCGSESDAYLKLPHETLASKVEEIVEGGAAELDYRLKQNARFVDALLDIVSEVKSGVGHSGPAKL